MHFGVSAYQREPYGMFSLQTSLPPEWVDGERHHGRFLSLLNQPTFVEQTGVEPVSEYPFLGINELDIYNFEKLIFFLL